MASIAAGKAAAAPAPKPAGRPKAKRERTPEELHAARIREGKQAIEGKLRKYQFMAYLLVSVVCIGGYAAYRFVKNRYDKQDAPPPRKATSMYDRPAPSLPPGMTLVDPSQPQQPAAPVRSRGLERQLELLQNRFDNQDYLGAIDQLEDYASRNPDDAKQVEREIARIKRQHPNETGEGPFWELKREYYQELIDSREKAKYEEAAEVLIAFRKKHPDEGPVATYYLNKLSGQYLQLFHEPLPTPGVKKKKVEEEDYGDWGGGNQNNNGWNE